MGYQLLQERLDSGVESVGDEDVARALLAACKGATEPVLNAYDQLLSNGAILPSPNLRLHLLRSVLAMLREWAMSVLAQRMGTTISGASLILVEHSHRSNQQSLAKGSVIRSQVQQTGELAPSATCYLMLLLCYVC